jgi:hypothetical protein
MREFHILILDDDIKVIERLRDRISPRHLIVGTTWNVQIRSIHVNVTADSFTRFSKETLKQLVDVCSQPPNLILADFGYPTQQQTQQFTDGTISSEQFMGKILTASDLVPAVQKFLEDNYPNDIRRAKQIQAGLSDNPCKLFLYTFTFPQYKRALPSIDARVKRTQGSFRRSVVIPIDTRVEFFDDEKYVDKHDLDFYAYLLSGLLEYIIRQELLEHVLRHDIVRLKYIRYSLLQKRLRCHCYCVIRWGYRCSLGMDRGKSYGINPEWFLDTCDNNHSLGSNCVFCFRVSYSYFVREVYVGFTQEALYRASLQIKR